MKRPISGPALHLSAKCGFKRRVRPLIRMIDFTAPSGNDSLIEAIDFDVFCRESIRFRSFEDDTWVIVPSSGVINRGGFRT